MDNISLFLASERTILLAPVVGAYLCLTAVGLLRRGELSAFLGDLRQHPGSMHAVGAVAFLAGASILSFQRQWSAPGDLVLNSVAAIWVFEGAGMLASPAVLRAVFRQAHTLAGLRVSFTLMALVGVYLSILGVAGKVG